MAEFVRKDGKPIKLPKRPPAMPGTLVGLITSFETNMDFLNMKRSVRINLEIPEDIINEAGGLVPNIGGGIFVEIRQVDGWPSKDVYVCADCGRNFTDGAARDAHYMSSDCPKYCPL